MTFRRQLKKCIQPVMDSTDTNDHGMESILACTLIYYHVDFLLNFSGAIILSMLIDRTDVCL